MMNTSRLRHAPLLLALAQAACGGSSSAPDAGPDAAPTSCTLVGRRWRMTADPVCAESFWTFTAQPDGSVAAVEEGCAAVRGTGRWEGGRLVVRGATTAGDRGELSYDWTFGADCARATGTLRSQPDGQVIAQGALAPAP